MKQDRILTVTLNPALDISTETEEVIPELKLRCAPPRSQPGGGGVNVSRAIIQMGGKSRAIVAVGGYEGRALIQQLRAAGLAPVPVKVEHATRSSLAVTETRSGAQYRFVMPGLAWAPADCDAMRAALVKHTKDGDILVASGSLPPGVPADFFSDLARRLPHLRMIFDSSGDALRFAAEGQGLDVLRMDDTEASELTGQPMDHPEQIATLARDLHQSGAAKTVLIAAGAQGTVMADDDGCWLTIPPKVVVRSKVGAGDSFVAAYVLTLARGASRLDACIAGTGAAAAAVETPDSDLCNGPQADLRASQTRVKKL